MVNEMKKILIKILIPILIVLKIASCNDPIFYHVSIEPPNVSPLITGSPTNFILLGGNVFVASRGRLFSYNIASEEWTEQAHNLPHDIRKLAVIGTHLYAHIGPPVASGSIWRTANPADSTSWTIMTADALDVRAMYTDGTFLFFSVRHEDDQHSFSIYRFNNPLDAARITGTQMVSDFRGAARTGTTTFLITGGSTQSGVNGNIFAAAGTPPASVSSVTAQDQDLNPYTITNSAGIINLGSAGGNTIIVSTSDGNLYSVTSSLATRRISYGEGFFTEALSVWTDGTNHLLLVGRRDNRYSASSGYRYGYLEIAIGTGGITGTNLVVPGSASISTVIDTGRYRTSIGTRAVFSIFQPAAPNSLLFASTSGQGVWHYIEAEDRWNRVQRP